MLNKPTYAIVTMVSMGTLWLLGGKMVAMGDTIFSKLFVSFSVRALIMKVQSNKSVYQSKELSKYIFRCYGKFAFTSE